MHKALLSILQDFLPPPTRIDLRQRVITVVGVLIGMGIAAVICGAMRTQMDLKWWLMAPLGASAAQVFSVPGSPMSQPWPIIAGHALSALAGLVCFHLFGETSLSAAAAVALATALMLQSRSLHPSGGGTALFVVLSKTSDFHFILFPVVTNAVILVGAAMAYHRMTGHAYPQRQTLNDIPHNLAMHRFDPSDLEAALMGHNQALDMSRADIEALIERTELQAYQRMASKLTCSRIMTPKVRAIEPRTQLSIATATMLKYDIKALPVIDDDKRVIGLLRREDAEKANPAIRAGQIMARDYAVARPEDPATVLLSLLSDDSQRHVLILDNNNRLAGLISKSDLMRALFHTA